MKAAPALAPMINLNRDRIASKFKRALLVDDDVDYGQSISDNLSSIGVKTDVVGSLAAAVEHLVVDPYPIVFFDNIFEDRPELKGSEFIRDETKLLKNSEVVLMTGYAVQQIANSNDLEKRGVHIVRKAPGHIEEIKSICEKAIQSNIDRFTSQFEQFCSLMLDRIHDPSDIEGLIPEPRLLRRARTYLLDYLAKMPNPELEQFYFEGKSYSPRELAAEVAAGSRPGAILLEQFLDDVLEGSETAGEQSNGYH